jgi:hypothetical protein
LLIRTEAEQWSAQGGGTVRVLDNPDASGGRTVSYWEDQGVWLEVTLEVPRAGDYLLSVGYALGWPESTRQVSLNGRPLGAIKLPGTSAWTIFTAATTNLPPLSLTPGKHTLRFLNADSVGLSLDWVALHTPEVYFTDRVLAEQERQELLRRWQITPQRTLARGIVEVQFDGPGRAAYARIGETVLAAPTPDDARLAPVTLHETRHFRLATLTGDSRQLWITDGSNLYLVHQSRRADLLPLPAPVLAGDRRVVIARPAEGAPVNFSTTGWPPQTTPRLELGGLHLTATAGLQVGPWQPQGMPELGLAGHQHGDHFLGAAKWSARWGADEPGIGYEQRENQVLIRDTTRHFPTLATFYGEKPFEVTIQATEMTFTDVTSGQTITLP